MRNRSLLNPFRAAFGHRLRAPLSAAGVLAGACFWWAALTPSLIPRDGVMQGVIAGLSFGVGYGLAVAAVALWKWLGLPVTGATSSTRVRRWVVLAAASLMLAGAILGDGWQDAVREALALPPSGWKWPVSLLAAGIGLIAVLLLVARFFYGLRDLYGAPLRRVLPERAALVFASLLAAWSFWALGNGFLLGSLLRGMDASYRKIDALVPADEQPPTDPLKPGSALSLLPWESLGHEGRKRVLASPGRDEVSAITGRPAKEPLRVYVGLNSAATPDDRAAVALAEMKRVGAFDRRILVITTPTGTGWIDPAAMAPLEVMHHGDVASVAVQYSYLPSWLTLLVDPGYGEETAHAVFGAVHGHWRTLPEENRPRLFLFGLSLGSLHSDLATEAYAVAGDPFDGAFWVGPPFASRQWPRLIATRREGSPAWLPAARHATVFRSFTADDRSQLAAPDWGPPKVLYLQYPSDPIVFFRKDMWWREPDWMKPPRGPGVSPALTWWPGISFIQGVFDMMTATTVPKGRGHVYAGRDYAEGWRALTQPPEFDAAAAARLAAWMEAQDL